MTAAVEPTLHVDLLAALRIARPFLAGGAGSADELAALLYTQWFTLSGQAIGPLPTMAEPPTLVARIRAAHPGTARFEPGWHVQAVGVSGELVVERNGAQLAVLPPDYVNVQRPAVPAQVGDTVSVVLRRDFVDQENGWWMSDGRLGPAPATPMVRLYWNCPPQSAPALVAELTAVLEAGRVRYSMKCPVEASLFGRADAAVVYFEPEVFESCKHELRELHAQLADSLDAPTPPLTLRLGRGVAAAEDPGDGQSYGQSRCAAVADALVRADRDGLADEAELVDAMLDGLEAHGISRTHPFLGSESPDDLVTPW